VSRELLRVAALIIVQTYRRSNSLFAGHYRKSLTSRMRKLSKEHTNPTRMGIAISIGPVEKGGLKRGGEGAVSSILRGVTWKTLVTVQVTTEGLIDRAIL